MRRNGLKDLVKTVRRRIRGAVSDAVANRRHARGDGRFLVVRHPARKARFYDVVLEWLEREAPSARARFELRQLPCRPRDPSRFSLLIPWLQDPVEAWSPRVYGQASRLSRALAAAGIPTVNPVERLGHATKSVASGLLRAAGIRAPRTVPIADVDEFRETRLGLALPLIVREDRGHAGPDALGDGEVVRLETEREVRDADLARFERPVAMEFLETGSAADGLYRKYRSFVAGDVVVPHHVQVKDHWFVKGGDQLYSEAIRDEDLAFLSSPDPHAEMLVRAREALSLDVVAFDYALDASGAPVVWEANPFPLIHFLPGRRAYRSRAVARTISAIVRQYHVVAGLPVPDDLIPHLEYEAR